MTIHLRPLVREDLNAVLAIERVSFSDPWTRGMFLSELEPRGYNQAFGAVDTATGELVGYCFIWVLVEDEIHIANIAVRPSHRKLGVGRLMINEAIRRGKEAKAGGITLEVRESNTGAREFYRKLGFEEAGRRVGYYRKPFEDALILRLSL
ncbi:MAG TPA: ribosomal protein S18-alanine N-acetyltransferase [bacterium]|nr:ribosomal protein S18-alanine N-acetyltransferase [bacterium]HOL94169.1 ribosomal protein S18-alanine N-acetyltransferase [bacterium]HPP00075.1 ribosomal protein S18-alanine N-acetyltransferase [bacterium]HXK95343.1 ribosomal protein S18-alanine N-acetyltransferase [bacterium]